VERGFFKTFFIDSITHIVLGAVIGDGLLHKKIGKRAMFLGAVAQSIPDVDFISAFWNDPASNLLAHRGFTHSLLFDLLATLLFSLIADHWHKKHEIGYPKWVLFFGLQISIHLLLDMFNSYGMGLFEPFSHQRISWNMLFVADPFFSFWPAIAFIGLLFLKDSSHKRKFWRDVGIIGSIFYLLYCGMNKNWVDREVRTQSKVQNLSYNDYITTPTPLNNWLWYAVIKQDSGYYAGYYSLFDRKPIKFHYVTQNKQLLQVVSKHEEVQHLIRFSEGFYTVEQWHDTLVFNVLRFGQIAGWENYNQKFAFHYFLDKTDANRMVVQRGRFEGWTRNTVKSMWQRIKGN
jgi:Predicted membrane-bound metal-dependent hydrolases